MVCLWFELCSYYVFVVHVVGIHVVCVHDVCSCGLVHGFRSYLCPCVLFMMFVPVICSCLCPCALSLCSVHVGLFM